jgi:hypothetical protein
VEGDKDEEKLYDTTQAYEEEETEKDTEKIDNFFVNEDEGEEKIERIETDFFDDKEVEDKKDEAGDFDNKEVKENAEETKARAFNALLKSKTDDAGDLDNEKVKERAFNHLLNAEKAKADAFNALLKSFKLRNEEEEEKEEDDEEEDDAVADAVDTDFDMGHHLRASFAEGVMRDSVRISGIIIALLVTGIILMCIITAGIGVVIGKKWK